MILKHLRDNIGNILTGITTSHLNRYDRLQKSLLTTNVNDEEEYQRIFNGYYKMQRRSQNWYELFFSLLEHEKHNKTITFQDVIKELYDKTNGRIEPSFSSKLVATIRPEMPVYDRYVRQNLSLEIPKQYEPASIRLKEYIKVYEILQVKIDELIKFKEFQELKKRFDEKFQDYIYFTDVKKLDLLLWKNRQPYNNISSTMTLS